MKLSGARIAVERLAANGADIVFGYPGGAVLPLYDELYRNSDRVRHYVFAHEQGAAHAADGYARASGKTGVVIATSGPGATNLVTGLANAYLDSVPMVAVTGNAAIPLLGKDSFQEVDIAGITQAVVKHNFVVRKASVLAAALDEAFRIANDGRRGPVLVDIPKSVQEEQAEYGAKEALRANDRGAHAQKPGRALGNAFEDGREEAARNAPIRGPGCFLCACDGAKAVAEALACSARPFIYAGGGLLASGAETELAELSSRLAAPVGFTMMGLTALPWSHPLNLGMCGMHGRYAATVAQSECDFMLAIGVRFSDRATGNIGAFSGNRVIAHVDVDKSELGKNVQAGISVNSDAKRFLQALLDALPPTCAYRRESDGARRLRHAGAASGRSEAVSRAARSDPAARGVRGEPHGREAWARRISELQAEELRLFGKTDANGGQGVDGKGAIKARDAIRVASRRFGDGTVVATDVGQHQMWVMQSYPFSKPRTLLTSGGLGAMGYGLGAAIGGCLASGRKRTLLFTGDGSFGMNLNEMATAVTYKLPIVAIVLNNGVLGMVRQWQSMFYGARYSHTTLGRSTDFAALARAFGAYGYTAADLAGLANALDAVFATPPDRPSLIDCRTDPDEKALPMVPPGGTARDIVVA